MVVLAVEAVEVLLVVRMEVEMTSCCGTTLTRKGAIEQAMDCTSMVDDTLRMSAKTLTPSISTEVSGLCSLVVLPPCAISCCQPNRERSESLKVEAI